MNILFIVPYAPTLIRVRPYNLIKSLAARGHRISLATLWTSPQECNSLQDLRTLGVGVIAEPLSTWRSLRNCLRALPSRAPLQAAYCWQPALARRIQAWIEATPLDIIHVEHLRGAAYGLNTLRTLAVSTAWASGSHARRPAVVYDSVDCISCLFQQAASANSTLRGRLMSRIELARTRRYEAWLAGQFRQVLVTSPVDRRALLDLAAHHAQPTPCICVVPNGVDLAHFGCNGEPRQPDTLVFSGKMSYHANASAALYLVRQVMPLVWAERPQVRLTIVGQGPPGPVRALAALHAPRVSVTGTVPDIRPYLHRAAVAVAPMLYAAGIQNKVLEAMAAGTPVVASPLATAALAARPEHDLLVAESAHAFARATLDLLGDAALRYELGQAGRAYVQAHHAWDGIAAQLEAVYQAAMGG